MIIEYEVSKYIKEMQKLEIKDTKNVFLKGRNTYDNLPTYFGIWNNDGILSIVTIISYRTINYKHYLNENLSTKYDIEQYLKCNKNIEIISRNEFKEQIDNIISILSM
ncbi:MAG: hypothetical protein KIC60_05430 [Clostridium sp.]|nr:hypothetical protein [Clostridium sp.]